MAFCLNFESLVIMHSFAQRIRVNNFTLDWRCQCRYCTLENVERRVDLHAKRRRPSFHEMPPSSSRRVTEQYDLWKSSPIGIYFLYAKFRNPAYGELSDADQKAIGRELWATLTPPERDWTRSVSRGVRRTRDPVSALRGVELMLQGGPAATEPESGPWRTYPQV